MRKNPALEDFFKEEGLPQSEVVGRVRKLLNINGVSKINLGDGYLDPRELDLRKLKQSELKAFYENLYYG